MSIYKKVIKLSPFLTSIFRTVCFGQMIVFICDLFERPEYRLNYNNESKFWEVKIGSYIFKGITFHIVPITYLATVIFLQKQTEIDDYYPPCLISLKFVS